MKIEGSPDFEVVITDVHFEHLPETVEEHFEFIMIDSSCNNSMDLLEYTGASVDDCYWIIWNTDSKKVPIDSGYVLNC